MFHYNDEIGTIKLVGARDWETFYFILLLSILTKQRGYTAAYTAQHHRPKGGAFPPEPLCCEYADGIGRNFDGARDEERNVGIDPQRRCTQRQAVEHQTLNSPVEVDEQKRKWLSRICVVIGVSGSLGWSERNTPPSCDSFFYRTSQEWSGAFQLGQLIWCNLGGGVFSLFSQAATDGGIPLQRDIGDDGLN